MKYIYFMNATNEMQCARIMVHHPMAIDLAIVVLMHHNLKNLGTQAMEAGADHRSWWRHLTLVWSFAALRCD